MHLIDFLWLQKISIRFLWAQHSLIIACTWLSLSLSFSSLSYTFMHVCTHTHTHTHTERKRDRERERERERERKKKKERERESMIGWSIHFSLFVPSSFFNNADDMFDSFITFIHLSLYSYITFSSFSLTNMTEKNGVHLSKNGHDVPSAACCKNVLVIVHHEQSHCLFLPVLLQFIQVVLSVLKSIFIANDNTLHSNPVHKPLTQSPPYP